MLGPSGSGKSTLLNPSAASRSADEGHFMKISVADMTERNYHSTGWKHLGYIFSDVQSDPEPDSTRKYEVGAYLSDHALDVDELLQILGLTDHQKRQLSWLHNDAIKDMADRVS